MAMPGPVVVVLVSDAGTAGVAGLLDRAGCRVIVEGVGVQEAPDAIVVDVEDPARAVELCRRAATLGGSRGVPILVVGPPELPVHDVDAAGAQGVLVKPFDAEALAARLSAMVRGRRLLEQLEHAPDLLGALAQALEDKDDHTEGHAERVAVYGAALAERLGLSAGEVEAIRVGGLLHDVGKIGTPDAILNKAGPLTLEEFELVKRHPIDGWEICRHASALAGVVLDCVRHHHEKLDGSGYPDGLVGAEISLPARIVAIANVFDALATARTYKPAFPTATSFQILREEVERGWWDGDLVETFVALLRERELGGGGSDPPGPRPDRGPGPAGSPARLRPTDPPRVPPRPSMDRLFRPPGGAQ